MPPDESWYRFFRALLRTSFGSPVPFSSHALFSLEAALRGLAAVLLCAGTLLFSVRAARCLLPRAGLPLRWTAVFTVGAFTATVGLHVLRALGLFNLPAALLVCTGLGAAALWLRPGVSPLAPALRSERRALARLTRRFLHGPHALLNAPLVVVALFLLLRGFVVPPVTWDTLVYHGTRAAQWVTTGTFTFDDGPGTLVFYRNFPAGGEVLMAWAMLPFHSDLLVNAGTYTTWLWLGAATWALARALGVREPYAGCAVAVSMFMPTARLELSSGYVELPLYAALLSSFAFGVRAIRHASPGLASLAGMAAGVAIGVKITAGPPAAFALLAVAAAVLLRCRVPWAMRAATLVATGLAAIAPALPGLIFAWRDTGYPLSSMPIRVLGHQLGVADPQMMWLMQTLDRPPHMSLELAVLQRIFAPLWGHLGEALGAPALIPLFAAPVGFVLGVRRHPGGMLLLLAGLLAMLGAFFSHSFQPVRTHWPEPSARFLVGAVAVAAVLSLAACRPGSRFAESYRLTLLGYPVLSTLLTLTHGVAPWERLDLLTLALALVQLGLLVRWVTSRSARAAAVLSLAAIALGCGTLQVRRDATRSLAFEQSFAMHPAITYWAPWVKSVDDAHKSQRIAVTGGAHAFNSFGWFMYPFMGSHLQNRITYVPVTADGRIAHFGPFGGVQKRVDLAQWERRLDERAIDWVVTFPPRSAEQTYMEEAGITRFLKVAGNADYGLFQRISARPLDKPVQPSLQEQASP